MDKVSADQGGEREEADNEIFLYMCKSVCEINPQWFERRSRGSISLKTPFSSIPAHTEAYTYAWRETLSDFLLLPPIKGAVSPKPDERLTQMRKHLQRSESSPEDQDSSGV